MTLPPDFADWFSQKGWVPHPHQPSPMSLAVIPRPFLNRSMYHWTAARDSGVVIASFVPSAERSEPPMA